MSSRHLKHTSLSQAISLAYCGDVPGIHFLSLEETHRLSGSCVAY